MRYPASEKLEIIRLVERSHLPAKQTLDMLGIARTTFYRWYGNYHLDGKAALQDKAPLPARVVEPHSRHYQGPVNHTGAGPPGAQPAGAGRDLY